VKRARIREGNNQKPKGGKKILKYGLEGNRRKQDKRDYHEEQSLNNKNSSSRTFEHIKPS